MSILPILLRSLVLTGIFSFLVPIVLFAVTMLSLIGLNSIPGLESVGKTGIEQVTQFLSVFGSGNSVHGLLVIGVVGSLVGMLFDTYTFYRYQNLRNH